MTDSATVDLKMNKKIIEFKKQFINNMEREIAVVNDAQKKFDSLQVNDDKMVEKIFEIIIDQEGAIANIDSLLTERESFSNSIKESINSDIFGNELEEHFSLLRLQSEKYHVYYIEMMPDFFIKIRCLLGILRNELHLPKSREKQQVEDRMLDKLLCYSVIFSKQEITKEIINLSKSINSNRGFKFSNLNEALECAAMDFDSVKLITELLIDQQEEYNPVCPENGNTLLHYAVYEGHTVTVELILRKLFEENKEINSKNKEGITVFHLAIEKGDLVIVDMFLEALVKRKKTLNSEVHESLTPLHIAATNNNLSVFKKILYSILENGEEINPENESGLTPLHIVAEKCDADIFYLLSDNMEHQGKNLNPSITSDKSTVLHILAEKGKSILFEKLLIKLIEKNEECNPSCIDGMTPLHVASIYNHEEIVKLLIQKIKYKEGELSPEYRHSGQKITPFFVAAFNRHLNLVELFLKERDIVITENMNPTIKDGQTLFQWAIYLKNTAVLEKMLSIHLEKSIELPSEQMAEALALVNPIEILNKELKQLINKKNFEKCCIDTLTTISLCKSNEMAKKVSVFLIKNKDATFIHDVITASKKNVKNPEGIEFLDKIKNSIIKRLKREKDFRFSKMYDLKKFLIVEKYAETLSPDKSLLEVMQKKYNALYSTIEKGIKSLSEIKTALSWEDKFNKLKNSVKLISSDYEQLKNDFLIKEEACKRELQEQVNDLLKPLKEQMQWSRDLLKKSEKAIELPISRRTNNADLKLKIKNLAEVLIVCHLEVDKAHYTLLPSIQDKFKVLSECRRDLLGALIVFGGKDRENKEKEIAQKKQEESQRLEREIEKLTEMLSADLKVAYSFIEKLSTYFDKVDAAEALINDILKEKIKALKVNLLNFQEKLMTKKEKQKTILLENKEERKSLKDALEKEVQQSSFDQERLELEWRLSLIKSEVFNDLHAQRKTLEKEWLSKVEEIQEILSLVLKNNSYHSVISHKEDVLYSLCERYKKHFNFLEKSKLSVDEFDSKNDLSKEHKRMVELNADLLKRKKWLERKTEEVRSVEQELILRAFNETKIKVDDSQQSREVYLPSFQQKPVFDSKRKSKKTPLPLLVCYLEVERANQIVELLDSDKNTNRDLIVKKNALFLAIAMVCESLKSRENEILLKKTATEVRNAIYHALIEDKIDEEKYHQLMIFINELCHKGMMNKLESFFNIFPKAQPDYVNYIDMIQIHIQYLSQYYEKIENNVVNIEEDLVLQSDITFRLAQIFALQTDLSKVSDGQEQVNKEVRSQLQEMFKNLNMKKSMFRALANEVRHGGVEGVNIAINEWLMAVGGALSERSFTRDKTDKKALKDLSDKMTQLCLK